MSWHFGRKPQQISKRLFYQMGGLSRTDLFRRADRRGVWRYFQL